MLTKSDYNAGAHARTILTYVGVGRSHEQVYQFRRQFCMLHFRLAKPYCRDGEAAATVVKCKGLARLEAAAAALCGVDTGGKKRMLVVIRMTSYSGGRTDESF